MCSDDPQVLGAFSSRIDKGLKTGRPSEIYGLPQTPPLPWTDQRGPRILGQATIGTTYARSATSPMPNARSWGRCSRRQPSPAASAADTCRKQST
jgi:hypothetical protein